MRTLASLFALPLFGLLGAVLLTALLLYRAARVVFLHFFWPAQRQSRPLFHYSYKEGAAGA